MQMASRKVCKNSKQRNVCHSSTGRNFFKKADSSRILQEFNSEFRWVKNGGKFGIQN